MQDLHNVKLVAQVAAERGLFTVTAAGVVTVFEPVTVVPEGSTVTGVEVTAGEGGTSDSTGGGVLGFTAGASFTTVLWDAGAVVIDGAGLTWVTGFVGVA